MTGVDLGTPDPAGDDEVDPVEPVEEPEDDGSTQPVETVITFSNSPSVTA